MGLKGKIKIFWVEHSDPIIFYTIVVVAIILITQGLNALAKKKLEQNEISQEGNEVSNVITISSKENKRNLETINQFLDYCKNGKVENAYSMLSEKNKQEKYSTLNIFKQKYYNKIFNKKRNTEVKLENNKYKVIFYEDMLETGKLGERENIQDTYEIEPNIGEDKIIININNNIK